MFDFTPNQAEAINTLNCNVSVSAGAGSGKTRVLVERFINILAQGIGKQQAVLPREILAITFTRKAAAEMKERIRARLYQLEQEDAANKDFWRRQRQSFDQARISTIHGFCNGLLKENPVETQLDPAFTVAEENDMQEFVEAGVKNFVKKSLAAQDAAVQKLAQAYGLDSFMRQLLEIYGKIDEVLQFGDLTQPYTVQTVNAAEVQAQLLSAVDELIAGMDGIGKTTAHWQQLKSLQENLPAVRSAVAAFAEPQGMDVLDEYIGGMSKTAKKDKELVAEAQELVGQLKQSLTDARAAELAAAWQQVLQGCAEYIHARQAEQNLIGFDDLEIMALKLLQNLPDIREKYSRSFKYIMVDEFQDTNERQRQLVYLLCGGDADTLRGSKLFIVGDPKQSIYRFRGADVNVFARVRRDIAAGGGKNLVLDDNFRTVDKILDLCNETFPDLLGLDTTKDVFFEALKANRETEILPEMQIISYDAKTAALRPRQADALAVAQKVLALHGEGVPYSGMVILLRAMTNAALYEGALLDAGVPCNVVDGKGFYERQEIIDFVNLLTVCADSCRDLELAGVLRSPYFALDDVTLTALFFSKQDGESLWQVLMRRCWPQFVSAQKQQQLAYCAGTLESIYNAATALPLTELTEFISAGLKLEALLAAQPDGAEQLANIKKLFSLLRDFCQYKQGGLREYLDAVQKLRQRQAREAAAVTAGENSVTIMTIHKSKGLEFPTVILPALDAHEAADRDAIRFDKSLGLGIKADVNGKLEESSVFKAVKKLHADLNDAEKQRQFYVAMTRAKDRLVLSGVLKTSAAAGWFKKLTEILGDYTGLDINVIDAAEITTPDAAAAVKSKVSVGEGVLRQIQPLPNYGRGWQQSFSASALQQYGVCQRSFYYHYVLQMPMVQPQLEGGGALNAAALGTLIHSALQVYSGNLKTALYFAAERNGIALSACGEAEELLKNYLASGLYPGLEQQQLHELEFNLPLLADYGISASCHGFIDNVLLHNDGTAAIIDYKTGQAHDETPLGYVYQLALYKKAAEEMLGRKVTKAQLHFLRGCTAYTLPDDFDLAQIAALLCEIFAKNNEDDFSCTARWCRSCPYSYFCKNS